MFSPRTFSERKRKVKKKRMFLAFSIYVKLIFLIPLFRFENCFFCIPLSFIFTVFLCVLCLHLFCMFHCSTAVVYVSWVNDLCLWSELFVHDLNFLCCHSLLSLCLVFTPSFCPFLIFCFHYDSISYSFVFSVHCLVMRTSGERQRF